MRRWREKYPLKHAYSRIKDSAKRRRIVFTITYGYFEEFCKAQLVHHGKDYASDKGYTGDGLTIDRIDATKGYEPGNLQILTHSENVKKGNAERIRAEYVEAKKRRYRPEDTDDSCIDNEPF
jgi:hypothetical protein